jgi:hypothetical protein
MKAEKAASYVAISFTEILILLMLLFVLKDLITKIFWFVVSGQN